MKASGIQQSGLAEVMEVSIDRVKSLTSGKVKKLSPDEIRHLVRKLGLNAHWLATGEGAMFSRDESHDEFTNRMQAVNRMAELIKAMPLPDLAKAQLCAVMSGNAAHDAPLIAQALAMQALPPAQQELIAAFEGCSPEGQQHLIQTAKLLSTGMPVAPAISPKRGAKAEAPAPTQHATSGGVNVGGSVSGDVLAGSNNITISRSLLSGVLTRGSK